MLRAIALSLVLVALSSLVAADETTPDRTRSRSGTLYLTEDLLVMSTNDSPTHVSGTGVSDLRLGLGAASHNNYVSVLKPPPAAYELPMQTAAEDRLPPAEHYRLWTPAQRPGETRKAAGGG